MTKRKTPFFFTFKGLSNLPIFQYLNFSFHRHFKPLQIAPENTGNGISETPKIKKNFFLGVPPSAGIYPNPPFVKCWIRPSRRQLIVNFSYLLLFFRRGMGVYITERTCGCCLIVSCLFVSFVLLVHNL